MLFIKCAQYKPNINCCLLRPGDLNPDPLRDRQVYSTIIRRAEYCVEGWTRTSDSRASPQLYQLSYLHDHCCFTSINILALAAIELRCYFNNGFAFNFLSLCNFQSVSFDTNLYQTEFVILTENIAILLCPLM